MKKPTMLFTSTDAKSLTKRDLDNGAMREALIKTLQWYESHASQQPDPADPKKQGD